jgi:hydroxymethylglutaryl-CoA synthase
MSKSSTGISGISVYVPPFRVDLKDWCAWRGADWDKIRDVVGTGFRLPGTQHGVYTMAANAVLRLIDQCDIDPTTVRYLALGTESSTDNSAGAVIAKGMVDDALRSQGKAPLSRNCEVPEFKHACLGGVYALKNAIRFLNTDGAGSKAIVVCSDVALYEQGSSGEPTQGAGAVAMLLECDPKLARINLAESGSASDYRSVDFRKPLKFRNGNGHAHSPGEIPVFNGRYSAACYIDEMLYALDDMYQRRNISAADYFDQPDAIFMHRPFRRMPENALGMAYLFSLDADNPHSREQLQSYCDAAGVGIDAALAEMRNRPQLAAFGVRDKISDEAFPLLSKVNRAARTNAEYARRVKGKMSLGLGSMEELGNLYTGALPAWLAAGLEEAAQNNIKLDQEILLIGYGSGDAAEVIPIHLVEGWQKAAQQTQLADAMANPIDLSESQYTALREGKPISDLNYEPRSEFVIDRIGSLHEDDFQDTGIEYYRFIN